MATPRKSTAVAKTEKPTDVQAAAELVLEREAERLARLEKRRQRQARQREKQQLAAVRRMQESIEVMKWCIVGIAGIMFLGVILAIWTLSALNKEVEHIKAEVERVQPEIEEIVGEVAGVANEVGRVREALHNPMQSIGNAFGKELDAKMQNFMGNRSGTSDE